jgi:hypothetical protein
MKPQSFLCAPGVFPLRPLRLNFAPYEFSDGEKPLASIQHKTFILPFPFTKLRFQRVPFATLTKRLNCCQSDGAVNATCETC